jgi:hypothetical protein
MANTSIVFRCMLASAVVTAALTTASWAAGPLASESFLIAQAGGTGGTIGQQEKSISGGDVSAPPARREHGDDRGRSRPARSSGSRGGGGGNYDGAWAVVSVGQPCGSGTTVVVITGGKIIGNGLTGRVGSNGSAHSVWQGGGITSTASGRLSGHSGSGSFRRSDGCVGRWTAMKQ